MRKGSLLGLFSAACVQLTAISRDRRAAPGSFQKAFLGSGKVPTKAFRKVSLDVSPTYALGVEAAFHLDCCNGIEQPAARYAASRAHARLQLRRARQLEVFRGEDVPSTST